MTKMTVIDILFVKFLGVNKNFLLIHPEVSKARRIVMFYNNYIIKFVKFFIS